MGTYAFKFKSLSWTDTFFIFFLESANIYLACDEKRLACKLILYDKFSF